MRPNKDSAKKRASGGKKRDTSAKTFKKPRLHGKESMPGQKKHAQSKKDKNSETLIENIRAKRKAEDDQFEDSMIEEESQNWFHKNPTSAKMISRMSALDEEEETPVGPSRKKAKLNEDFERDFEKGQRIPQWEQETDQYLPVFTDGKLQKPDYLKYKEENGEEDKSGSSEDEQEQTEESSESSEEDIDPEVRAQQELNEAINTLAERKKRRQTLKERIALTSMAIMEDPHSNYKKLAGLVDLCRDTDGTVCKLALISAGAVFKDVIPGYSIRTAEQEETSDRLSKNYGKMRQFELALLESYQQYLLLLDKALRGKLLKSSRRILIVVSEADKHFIRKAAVEILGSLVKTHPHFNFRTNIINSLLPVTESPSRELRKEVFDDFTYVIKNDPSGAHTYEIAHAISNLIKRFKFGKGITALKLLNQIVFRHDLLTDEKLLEQLRKKKKSKKNDDVAKELSQGEAQYRPEQIAANHKKILETMFLTYARILKKAPHSPLLPYVLEGIAKFGHLVSISFLRGLMEYLEDMLKEETLNGKTKMEVFLALHSLRQGEGEALNVDFKQTHLYLYQMLGNIPHDVSTAHFSLVIRCFERFIQDRKQIEASRAAAFIKRLLTLALSLPPHCALSIILLVRCMFEAWPATKRMLDNDNQMTGNYNPEIEDPDFAYALSSTVWELHTLKKSTHPIVAQAAQRVILLEKDIQIPGIPILNIKGAENALEIYDCSTGTFFPAIKQPAVHPQRKRVVKLVDSGDLRHFPKSWINDKFVAFQQNQFPQTIAAHSAKPILFRNYYQLVQNERAEKINRQIVKFRMLVRKYKMQQQKLKK
eukprot:c8560_g1_i1.p1 GENE.c8560_g1_i1~~c8560_g1_i1.p1  ORF type:complete len:839 (-),score=316.78 c8560_g1_i1:13-2481(-)